jgi:hypothetical protein
MTDFRIYSVKASRKALTVYADEIKSTNPTLAEELLSAIKYESL